VEETKPARDPGVDHPRIPSGSDFEYDEAHDVPAGPRRRDTPATHRVEPPSGVQLGEGGDYGYDEAHDFCARQSSKT
jgi:hypothetical protein